MSAIDKTTMTAELKGPWPQLTEDQKAELRTAAPQLVATSRLASEHAHGLVKIQPAGIWQAVAVSAAHSLAAMAGGLALLGATAAWLACGDGETDRDVKPNNTDSNAAPAATKGE